MLCLRRFVPADLDENDVARRHATPPAAMIDRSTSHPASLDAVATIATDDAAGLAAIDDGGPRHYAGGKNGAGVYQRHINQIPPHDFYIEAFLGSGAILRRILPARAGSVGIDVDAGVIVAHDVASDRKRNVTFIHGCALAWLSAHCAVPGALPPRTFIYCDPPYVGSVRAWPDRACYRHEMKGEREHAELLRILTAAKAMVMIVGYRGPLYDGALASWRRIDYMAMTRGGVKPESMWMNYAEPTELHDYRYLGDDYRERLRIARKIARWQRRLGALPVLERQAVIRGILSSNAGAGDGAAEDPLPC